MHIPVLLQEINDHVPAGSKYVYDGTLGAGGHAKKILDTHPSIVKYIGVDRDEGALEYSKVTLASYTDKVIFRHNNLSDILEILKDEKIDKVDAIIMDLGLSSRQLEESGRGFTFQKNEPLDMNMSTGVTDITAAEIINSWGEADMSNVFYAYGEETFARVIARKIVEYRKHHKILDTFTLKDVVADAIPRKFHSKRIHPATKVFQALRIAVNDELKHVERAISDGVKALSPGGVMMIISFHSLEDRIVKHAFREIDQDDNYTLLTKKPIAPTDEEVRQNPRSRSAKLRIIRYES